MNTNFNFIYTYGSRIAGIIAILGVTIYIAKFLTSLFERLQARASKDRSLAHISPTHLNFVKHLIRGITYFIGICFALSLVPELRSAAYSMLAGSGVVAVMITFASREAFANIFGGLLIQIFSPFQVGSYIKIDSSHEGIVTDITLHHTIIKTPTQNRLMVPNAVISNKSIETVKWPKDKIIKQFDVPVSYKADLDTARELIQQLLESHKSVLDTRNQQQKAENEHFIPVQVEAFMPDHITLRSVIAVKNDADFARVKSDVNAALKKAYDNNKILLATQSVSIVTK